MSKRFILHIGANKTGTSSIQRMLVENRGKLAASGWEYPDFHLLHMAHHRLAYSISGHPNFSLPGDWEGEFRRLVGDRDKRFIFSSELFFRTVDPARVAQFFPPEETIVVLYLREHLGYMMSWYAQAVQERNLTASFGDYMQLFAQPFSGYLAKWDAVYGAENVKVRVFHRDSLEGKDARTDFLQFIENVGPEMLVYPEAESNLSISGNLLFFKKVLNNYITQKEAETPPITDEIGAFAGVSENFRGKFFVPPEEANLARHLFRNDLERLKRREIFLPPMPAKVEGHLVPDFNTLHSDFKLIKRIAVDTNKQFLTYTNRWQDWHSIAV